MASPVAEALVTAEQFALMTDAPGRRTELIRGRVIEMPPAKTAHGSIGNDVGFSLTAFARKWKLGQVTAEGGYQLRKDPDTVRAPDTAFLANERIPAAGL